MTVTAHEYWKVQLDDAAIGMAWSPDNQAIAAASAAGQVLILDAKDGRALHSLAGHKMGTLQVSWAATGALLATGGQDGKVKLWNPATGELAHELDAGGRWVEQLGWSPDGTVLAAGAGKTLRLWNASGGMQFEFAAHESTISAMQWRGDGRGLATACYGNVRLFRIGENLPYEHLKWKSSMISLAWSPNGRFVAAGTQDNAIQFWRIPFREAEPLQMSGYPAKVKNFAWDRTSQFLATDGGEVITVWDVSGKGPAGRKPLQIKGHESRVSALAYQRKGDHLASGDEAGVVNVVKAASPSNPTRVGQFGSAISQICWSPDERIVAVGTRDGIVTLARIS